MNEAAFKVLFKVHRNAKKLNVHSERLRYFFKMYVFRECLLVVIYL